ncbi:hypothetical protein H310_12928 [Aphanomyces invadans]|uniref:RING-type E3 ubiquitin transferase n=1 Tax=Aphanomyces invadans TaxID=157072 RepID=A0A024TFL0_9STRA|nr:hypothetical protein H310_12928 [Aphanomyces invadans]ETV92915.1 hypothetical protein H310_12928 [Aphanomyces invadans]|eukprot:XP_008878436.1 hypothetical protein H310_12928 [Aphanomyces invadans]
MSAARPSVGDGAETAAGASEASPRGVVSPSSGGVVAAASSTALNVRVTVRYPAPANAKVPDILALFRSATWVNVMIRYIVPYLKTSTPANRDIVTNLPHHACCGGEDCVICMSSMQDAVTLPCGHHFHADCIDAWLRLRSTCPTCRHQIQNAFSGRYAFKGINTALVIDDLDPSISVDALQRLELGGRVLKAVVRIAMVRVTHVPELEKFPCELNAMVMTGSHAMVQHLHRPPSATTADTALTSSATTTVPPTPTLRRQSSRSRVRPASSVALPVVKRRRLVR